MTTTTLTTAAPPGDWWKQGWNKFSSFVRCEPTMVTTTDEPPVSSFEATQVIPSPGDDDAAVMVRCNDCHHLVPEANVAIHQANCARRPSLEQASTQQTAASPEQDSAQRQQDNNTQRRMPFLSNFPGFRKREDNPKQEEERDDWEMVERDNTQDQRDVNEWACPRCTLLNPSSSTRCGACRYNQQQQRESDSVRRGRPVQPSNQQRQNTTPPPGSWMGGGAVVGGILGALIGALAGNPVGGAVNGAMNGAMSGAIAESASRAQAMQQQQTRARQRGLRHQAHQTRPRTNAGMMQTRIHYPDGTVRIVAGGDPFMARAMARSLNTAHNNNSVDGMSYDQLLQTFGDGSENVNRGADERLLASLPTSRVKETSTTSPTKASEQCPICLESFKKGDSRKTLPCLHGFHAGCVDKWLRTNASCPMCKHPIE